MRRVLITGGAGFIGQTLMRRLAGQVDAIVLYDCMLPQVHGEVADIPDLPANTRLVIGDIRDRDCLGKTVLDTEPDSVFHFAADTGTGQSHDKVTRYCDVNITGTATLIECLRQLPAPVDQVVLASSRAVYGEGAYVDDYGRPAQAVLRDASRMKERDFSVRDSAGRILQHRPSGPDTRPAPVSIYGTTKLAQEYLLQQGFAGTGTACRILRLQNVYGAGQSLDNPYTGVLSIMARQILEGRRLNIFEDGEMLRDFVYVDDVVEAMICAASLVNGESVLIDIGTGKPVRILDAAKLLLRSLGVGEDHFTISGDFRAGDIRHAAADISLAERILGWQPDIDPEDGMSRLTRWVRETFPSSPAA